jgi:acyl carrier protein
MLPGEVNPERARKCFLPDSNVRIAESLAGFWSEVLGVEAVAANDEFFDLGGSSIQAMQVMSRIHREFNIELPLTTLFDHPTLRGLAEAVVRATVS